MSSSSTAKNLRRITESVEQHDSSCESKAKAVCLCPYELERLGFDSVVVKGGRRVPIKADDSLGTGRLRVVCDGYHGPKKDEKEEYEEPVVRTVEERELVPAGAPSVGPGEPWPHRGGPKGLTMVGGRNGGKQIAMERICLHYEEHNPDAKRVDTGDPRVIRYRNR